MSTIALWRILLTFLQLTEINKGDRGWCLYADLLCCIIFLLIAYDLLRESSLVVKKKGNNSTGCHSGRHSVPPQCLYCHGIHSSGVKQTKKNPFTKKYSASNLYSGAKSTVLFYDKRVRPTNTSVIVCCCRFKE